MDVAIVIRIAAGILAIALVGMIIVRRKKFPEGGTRA
jgi:hypothetical protein